MEKTITDPNISTELEYRIKNRNGETKWIWEILQKLPAGSRISGETGKIQGIVRDITERKMAEEMLKLKLEELARSNAELE